MKSEENYDQMSLLKMSAITGFAAGILVSILGYLLYFLNLTVMSPAVILFAFKDNWTSGWQGFIITIILYGLLSIAVALVYYYALRKKGALWWGAGYGIFLFAVVFFVFQTIIPGLKPISTYDVNTILTTVCSFVLYGVFIGYSISYEYEALAHLKESDVKQ